MNNKQEQAGKSIKDVLAKKIATGIVQGQLRLCRWLSQWDRKLKPSQRKWLFLLLVGIAACYCGFLLLNGILAGSVADKIRTGKTLVVPVDSSSYKPLLLPAPEHSITEKEQIKNQKQQ